MSADLQEHAECPWCRDAEMLFVAHHERPADDFAVSCSACGCFGPCAPTQRGAWDAWDERDEEL